METKWRLIYNGRKYVFDDYPLEGVDVTETQNLKLTTHKGQEISILISPEIPVQVEAFTPGSGRVGIIL